MNANVVLNVMKEQLQWKEEKSLTSLRRLIRATYGFGPNVVAGTWLVLERNGTLPPKARVHYLLWMLIYFKSYNPFEVYCSRFKVCKNTFRKWVKAFATAIAHDKTIVSTSMGEKF